MGENTASKNQLPHHQVFDVSVDVAPQASFKCFDDDGRLEQTGTVCTASVQIIIAVPASDIQSLNWAMAQLGWIAGPAVMLLFSFVTFYSSTLLFSCYRSGNPISGGAKVTICGLVQFFNLFGVATACTIVSAISMMAIERLTCFRSTHGKDPCHRSINPYMITFGVAQIIFSQIPNLDQSWLLSVVATVMSIINLIIGLTLAVPKLAEIEKFSGSLTCISIGTETQTQKIWRSFQALGNDMLRAPPSNAKTMQKASQLGVVVIALFNLLCGCMDYSAFGDNSPGNLLPGFYYPYWLLDIANAAVVIHLVGAYQVCCQPLFAFNEKNISTRFPDSKFITKEIGIPIPIPISCPYKLNLFRLVWRTTFVITTTVISMLLPFFNDVVGLLEALRFWPLTVYFPVEMYIVQRKIPKWSARWLCLQILSVACLIITIAAAAGSIAGVVHDVKSYKPFKTTY